MKKLLIIVPLLLMISSACNWQGTSSVPKDNYNTQLQIKGKTLLVEIVNTPAEMEQGLSNRTSMAQNQGMLFTFNKPTSPAFWMKDMKFNLDLIWIYKNKIVAITADVPAPISINENLPTYSPPSTIDQVLEVNSSWSKQNGIEIGNQIQLLLP